MIDFPIFILCTFYVNWYFFLQLWPALLNDVLYSCSLIQDKYAKTFDLNLSMQNKSMYLILPTTITTTSTTTSINGL